MWVMWNLIITKILSVTRELFIDKRVPGLTLKSLMRTSTKLTRKTWCIKIRSIIEILIIWFLLVWVWWVVRKIWRVVERVRGRIVSKWIAWTTKQTTSIMNIITTPLTRAPTTWWTEEWFTTTDARDRRDGWVHQNQTYGGLRNRIKWIEGKEEYFWLFCVRWKLEIFTKMVSLQWIDIQITNLQTIDTHTAPRQRRQNLIGSERSN